MKYRSKVRTIDAVRFTDPDCPPAGVYKTAFGGFVVNTVGGVAEIAVGDYVIQEPATDRHYPCKPDLFEKRYELIDPQPLNPIVKLWPIPPGTRAEKCAKCPATIYKVEKEPGSGKPMPLAVAPELDTKGFGVVATLARSPTAQEEGFGYSHFSDCPEAAHFRKPKKPLGGVDLSSLP